MIAPVKVCIAARYTNSPLKVKLYIFKCFVHITYHVYIYDVAVQPYFIFSLGFAHAEFILTVDIIVSQMYPPMSCRCFPLILQYGY